MVKQAVFMAALVALTFGAMAEFKLDDNGKALTVLENGKPVLVYRYARVDPPAGGSATLDQERWWRMDYVHPLYGLDGDVLTEDFPVDHRHHRGVFWTWPKCKIGDRDMDLWTLVKARQVFDQWLARDASADQARIGVQNWWKFDDDPQPKVRERVVITVHPADEVGRAIDFELQFQNVTDQPVVIGGQTEENKGYGGFCVRPDSKRKPFIFTSAKGPQPEDIMQIETPWADVSSHEKPDGPVSGLAIFQNPNNPGYPHPGWIVRHYGFLGASWPHRETVELKPGDSFELRYRVYVHRGSAEEAKVAEKFQAYAGSAK